MCALVTGVQTCALPISTGTVSSAGTLVGWFLMVKDDVGRFPQNQLWGERSEERRVGKECVSTCRSWWSPYHQQKNSFQSLLTHMLSSLTLYSICNILM